MTHSSTVTRKLPLGSEWQLRRQLLIRMGRDAGVRLRNFFEQGVEVRKKGEIDLVTVADLAAEEVVIHAIRAQFPADAIHAEESGRSPGGSGFEWIVDPLDGTTNFAHGLPQFAISIGLAFEGEMVSGLVYDPVKEDWFEAHLGEGATLNGRTIRVKQASRLGDCLLVTGFSYDVRARLDEVLARLRRAIQQARGVRRFGSAALDLAYVACGRFDVYYEDGLKAWDIAAGMLLVSEAGGAVSDFAGKEPVLDQGAIVACHGSLLPAVLRDIVA